MTQVYPSITSNPSAPEVPARPAFSAASAYEPELRSGVDHVAREFNLDATEREGYLTEFAEFAREIELSPVEASSLHNLLVVGHRERGSSQAAPRSKRGENFGGRPDYQARLAQVQAFIASRPFITDGLGIKSMADVGPELRTLLVEHAHKLPKASR